MKKFIVLAMIALSFNAFAEVTTQAEFTNTINCLVANDTGNHIVVDSIDYVVQTTVGTRVVTRNCNQNCTVPSGLIARFRGPSVTNTVIRAYCKVEYFDN